MKKVAVFLILLTVWCSGCVRDDLADCPPLQITVEVTDKNYQNIAEAEAQGVDVRKAEDLPFSSYVNSLYYVITDAEGKVVKEQANYRIENDEKAQVITLPADLPYGKYTVTVWGNLKNSPASPDDYRSLELEGAAAAGADVYTMSETFDYQYGNEQHMLGLKRTKGKLIIQAVGFPPHIDFVKQKAVGLLQRVDSELAYEGKGEVTSAAAWTLPDAHIMHTPYAPSVEEDGSQLKVIFYDEDAHPGEAEAPMDMETVEEATESRIPSKTVKVNFARNTITLLKYDYSQLEPSMDIWVLVDGRWEVAHTMEID